MRYGVTVGNLGQFGDVRVLVDLAVRAEAAGWDGWFVWDHILYHDRSWPVVDPWVTLGAVAMRTRRVRLGVLVAAVPRYRPWRLAKTVASLDQLSGGRLVFGAALGSMPEEYDAFGEPSDPRTRADKLDEGLAIMDGLWRGQPVRHEGAHYRVDTTAMAPRSVQQPRLPVWVGGRWPARRPFRRAARWDGVMPIHADFHHGMNVPPGELAQIVDYTRAHRQDDGPFDVVMEVESSPDPDLAAELAAPYEAAGLTWWVEKLGWWRGDLSAAIERIEAGPPARG